MSFKYIKIINFILFIYFVSKVNPAYADNIKPPKQVWTILDSLNLISRDKNLFPQAKEIIGDPTRVIVAPIFTEGHAHYNTKIDPFIVTDSNNKDKELHQFISGAKAQNIPIYLLVDPLAWQSNGLATQPHINRLFSEHPDWREVRQQKVQGQVPDAFYASPWNPQVRKMLVELMGEVGQNFSDAAGIVIDLHLSDREITGFSEDARLASIRDLGLDPIDLNLQNRADEQNNAQVESWRKWKREQIGTFLKELRASYIASNPGGRVLVWGVADYYKRQEFNDLRLGQDWRSWLQNKLADGVMLEGRWTSRYTDTATFAGLPRGKDAPVIIPVSEGPHLVADSSYAADWSSLVSRVEDLDTIAFVVHSDTDIKSLVRLTSGKEKLVPPLAPTVNEPFPEVSFHLPDGGTWEARQVRGRKALAVLLNPSAMPGAEIILRRSALINTNDVQSAIVVSELPDARPPTTVSSASNTGKLLQLLDTHRDLLSSYSSKAHLVIADRAGWTRQVSVPKNVNELEFLLQHANYITTPFIVGQRAPNFSLPDMDGKVCQLGELQGKSNLLLTFFPKCFTGGCSNHLTSLRDEFSKFETANTKIWAVSIDPADVQIAFAKSLSLPFSLIPDTGRNLCFLYGAAQNIDDLASRQSVLIDKNGIVRWIDTDVQVHTHGTDVLTKMKELEVGR